MLRQTGTGWCPVKGTIVMDEDWWKKARSEIPGCGKFKKQGLQNEELLQRCFGDIVNLGIDHWSPHMVNVAPIGDGDETQQDATLNDMTQEEVDVDVDGGGTPSIEQISPINANGKRPPRPVQDKGKKVKTGTALLISEAVSSMATSATSFAASKEGKFSITEVMEHVVACGATYETNEHFIASELFVKKEQREMFMTLPNDVVKFNWLTRKYMAKYGN